MDDEGLSWGTENKTVFENLNKSRSDCACLYFWPHGGTGLEEQKFEASLGNTARPVSYKVKEKQSRSTPQFSCLAECEEGEGTRRWEKGKPCEHGALGNACSLSPFLMLGVELSLVILQRALYEVISLAS